MPAPMPMPMPILAAIRDRIEALFRPKPETLESVAKDVERLEYELANYSMGGAGGVLSDEEIHRLEVKERAEIATKLKELHGKYAILHNRKFRPEL